MFSQKKNFFKGKVFYILLLGLLVFGYWINQAPVSTEEPDDISAGGKHPVATDSAVNSKDEYDIMDNIIGGSNYINELEKDIEQGTTEEPIENMTKGYYLVKEVGGIVKVFYYDEEGNEKLIRTTDIAFSLLSIADQDLFQKGVIKHNIDELDELLQDFES